MSISGTCYTARSAGPWLKLIWTISSTGDCKQESRAQSIDGMVELCFMLETNIAGDTQGLALKYSLRKCENQKCAVRVNIASKCCEYSETGVNATENWTEWALMGICKPSHKVNNLNVYVYTLFILVSVYEVNLDALSSKLYADTDFTDFRLCAAEGSVAVHRACLAANSDVFRAMLTKEWKETTEGQINMKGVTVQTLQHLKDYMYLGTVPDEGLQPLLLIARFYLMKDLEKHCLRKLAETVTADELFSLIEFACVNQIPELPFAIMQSTEDSVINNAYLTNAIFDNQNEIEEKEKS